MRMTVEMSPRCVADPLLFVLAKSIPIEEEPFEEEPLKSPLWKDGSHRGCRTGAAHTFASMAECRISRFI